MIKKIKISFLILVLVFMLIPTINISNATNAVFNNITWELFGEDGYYLSEDDYVIDEAYILVREGYTNQTNRVDFDFSNVEVRMFDRWCTILV